MRHAFSGFFLFVSFTVFVIFIPAICAYYLYYRAADQYHSHSAFSVRLDGLANPFSAESAFSGMGGPLTVDSEVLRSFIGSQPLIERIVQKFDLSEIFNPPGGDFVFSLGYDFSKEELHDYWKRMVLFSVDTTSGMVDLEVRAFDPMSARDISVEIISACVELLKGLETSSRQNALLFVRDDLSAAEDRLREMRRTVLGFRLRNQIHIAESDAESKMGVVSALQTQLASELVDRQTILNFTGSSDTRIVNIDRRIQAIQNQITVEREELDRQFNESRPLSAIKSEYEALLVDLQFAENAYSAAYEAEKQLRTETHLRNRYLSVHIPPTLSDSSIYPHRALLLGTIIACMFAAWAICGLMFFNMIDRS